ncbi:MAG: hypothetical protein IPJ62_09395 [Betaproteobacteria bacterium]|nr:hypothetical protein [Betaproteobacteria bacterium]
MISPAAVASGTTRNVIHRRMPPAPGTRQSKADRFAAGRQVTIDAALGMDALADDLAQQRHDTARRRTGRNTAETRDSRTSSARRDRCRRPGRAPSMIARS